MSTEVEGFVKITKGEKRSYFIRLRDENDDPIDLTSVDEFQVCHPGDGGTVVIATETNVGGTVVAVSGDPKIGKIEVTLSPTDTAKLKEDERQDIDIEWDSSATPDPKRERLESVLTVVGSSCA